MTLRVALALSALALLPYLRAFSLPFISDDYVLLSFSQKWGPWTGWADLAQDVLFRCRATCMLLTYWLREAAGLWPPAYYAVTAGLHVVNTLLVAALGAWPRIGWGISIPAAAWFALHEIKQEAVMWYASVPELLVFGFLLAGLLQFRRWVETGQARWYAAAAACYLLALASKESGVVFAPLCVVFLWAEGRLREKWRWLLPFVVVAAVYTIPIFAARDSHRHLNDGTFVAGWHFLKVTAVSTGRLLWFWGALALLALWRLRKQVFWRPVVAGAAWTLVCLLPYAFLTYMPRVPSRHNYLASAGVALIGGAAWLACSRQWRRVAWALATVFVLHNTLYVWIVKYPQFVRRAQPTEQLIHWVAQHPGPFWLRCFPFSAEAADLAIRLSSPSRLEDLRFGEPPAGGQFVCLDDFGVKNSRP